MSAGPDQAPVLADVDGTLIYTAPIERWAIELWAAEHGLDPGAFLRTPGITLADRLAQHAPDLPPDNLARIIDLALRCPHNPVVLPGALDLLADIKPLGLVTSGARRLSLHMLDRAGLLAPPVVVTADEVEHGKPHPEPYLRGADLLGVEPSACVVLEDSPAGVAAGVAAGMTVVGITTTCDLPDLYRAGASLVLKTVEDYLRLRARGWGPSNHGAGWI